MANDQKQFMTAEGIKSVGIGKRGSKALPPDMVEGIAAELKANAVPGIIKGAFWGGFLMKGATKGEKRIIEVVGADVFDDPARFVEQLCPQAPKTIKALCERLARGKTLTRSEAKTVGDFLFSNEPCEAARGFIVSILRVRYETPDEYAGLLESIHGTIHPDFSDPPPAGKPVVQIAEPFDGVDHSNLITPLVAQHIQTQGYRVLCLAGRSSGPKKGNNLFDIAKAMDFRFLHNSGQLIGKPPLGWYLNLADLSPAWDKWVDRRRAIIKRPFLATLERFVNPFNSSIALASAFHPPYGEKMLSICEHAGFPGAIIVRNGIEGTTAFALKRATKVLCGARRQDGTYKRYQFDFDPTTILKQAVPVEEKLEHPSLDQNVKLIDDYRHRGQTGYALFDNRVKVTCHGLTKALQWVQTNMAKDK